jgi:hypothetical protein
MSTSAPFPTVRRPRPVALGLVRLATSLLPPGEARQRYRYELVSDLQYLDRPHQLTYATGVMSTAWALRRELTQEANAMTDTTDTPLIPLACKLNLHHDWHYVTNPEDGTRSRVCARCGKDDPRLGNSGMPAG